MILEAILFCQFCTWLYFVLGYHFVCFRRKLKIKLRRKLSYLILSLLANTTYTVFPLISVPCFEALTLFRMGGKPTSIPLFVSMLLLHWSKISRPYLVPVPNYWNWTKSTSQKYWFFWSNPCNIGVMMTSVIEMLELPNFGYMNTPAI